MTGSTSSKNPRHRTRGRKTRALSIPLIVLLTAVALGGAFTLVPRDKELFTRLINDGKYHRAGEFFLSKAYQSGRANGFAWALNGHPGGKGDPHAPAPRDPVLLLDRLIAATEDGPYPFYDEHVGYIDSLLYMSEDQADMFEAFKARALDLKSPARRRFYETLARVALGKGKPGTASEIYGALTREDPGAAEFTRQRVTCLRYASRPGEALDAIEAFAASTASREIPADLEQVRVALAREINRPGYAFDLLKSDYEKAKGTAGVDELMDQLVASAMHAGRLGEIQEICGDYVSRMPLATASWTEVAKAARPGSKGKGKRSTSGLGRESEFRHYAGMLAMWCEWNGKPDAAFDYYLKLAVLGDARALTRCFALDPGLRRQREITALLQERVEHHGNTAHRLQLARLLANEGRLREALPHYRNHVAANRRDTAAWRELGCIHDELSDAGSAASCYERALALAPSDDLSWKLANAYVELDRHQDALGVYRSLKDNSKALESAAILSESLGRYDDVAATQRNRLETLGKKATPKDFLDLAATHGALEEPDEESAAIETGLRRFPGSARLRIALADATNRQGETEAALRILENPGLRSRLEALSLYIQIANDLEDPSSAIRFLGDNIDEQHQFPLATLVDLSELHVNAGRPYIAERIIEKILRIDPNQRGFDWETLADASARIGNLEMAERFQKRHLASSPAAGKPESWEALGDIFDAQGKFTEAREAYRRSLDLYKDTILRAEL